MPSLLQFPDDGDLVRQVIVGNDVAFAKLYDRYEVFAQRSAFPILRDSAETEAAVIDAFTSIARARSRLNASLPFASYVYVVVRRKAFDRLPRLKHRAENEVPLESYNRAGGVVDSLLDPPLSPEDLALRSDRRYAILHAIACLRPAEATVIDLHYFGGYPYEDIARLLGRSVGAIKQLRGRGIERLRKELAHHGK